MKKVVVIIFALFLITNLYSQDKEGKKPAEKEKKKLSDAYSEITLEDFETTPYTDNNIEYRVSKEQKAGLTIRDQYPAPIQNSKKYIGLKLYGRKGDYLNLIPAKPIIIEKHCKTISIWVYGKRFAGELSMLLKDASGTSHRLIFGKLNFLGWKKLTVKLTEEVAQEDKYLSQKRQIEILKIIYSPGNLGRLPLWHYFYLDDITAVAREKYTDRQSDDW